MHGEKCVFGDGSVDGLNDASENLQTSPGSDESLLYSYLLYETISCENLKGIPV